MTNPNTDNNTPMSNEETAKSSVKAEDALKAIFSNTRTPEQLKADNRSALFNTIWKIIMGVECVMDADHATENIESLIVSERNSYEQHISRLNQTIADIEKDACEFAEFTHMNGWKPSTVDGRMWINPKQNLASTTAQLYQQFKLQTKGNEK